MHAPVLARCLVATCFLIGFVQPAYAKDPPVEIELETPDDPMLKKWGEDVKALLIEWHPRICNLLPSKDVTPIRKIKLRIVESDKGVADASGGTIRVYTGWIKKRPDDVGCAVHELVHVIQGYRDRKNPSWLVEGIADYVRWGIYEGKPQSYYPRPRDSKQGYKQAYQVAAGFLLWLETDKSPGIVNKLNTAMRAGKYEEKLFETHAGKPLDELWAEYVAPKKKEL